MMDKQFTLLETETDGRVTGGLCASKQDVRQQSRMLLGATTQHSEALVQGQMPVVAIKPSGANTTSTLLCVTPGHTKTEASDRRGNHSAPSYQDKKAWDTPTERKQKT
jgi:hypothetical protein